MVLGVAKKGAMHVGTAVGGAGSSGEAVKPNSQGFYIRYLLLHNKSLPDFTASNNTHLLAQCLRVRNLGEA